MRPLLLVALWIGLVLPGCSDSPKEAYFRVVQAAKLGHEEAFLKGFTKASANLIKALLTLSQGRPGIEAPYKYLVGDRVEEEVTRKLKLSKLRTMIDREKLSLSFPKAKSGDEVEIAMLMVKRGTTTRYICFIEEEGWKIDAFLTEEMRGNPRFRKFMLGKSR